MGSVAVLASCLSQGLAKPQIADPSLARILQEQRFNAGAGKFGSAFAQEDGVVYREESVGNNERTGQYSYIGDDGKTYTVKYSAGINGFRILGGDHIPSGGQNSADAITVNSAGEPKEYDYEYYDDTKPESPFISRNICWMEIWLDFWQGELSPLLDLLPSECQPLLNKTDSSHQDRSSLTDSPRDSISTSSPSK